MAKLSKSFAQVTADAKKTVKKAVKKAKDSEKKARQSMNKPKR